MTTTPVRTSRRALVHGAAWSVPVVTAAAAAPAFAASPCATGYSFVLDWGSTPYTKNSADLGTATVASGDAQPVVVSFASTKLGTGARGDSNLTVTTDTNIGNQGAGEKALELFHSNPTAVGRAHRQTVTITFSRAVTGLAFTISDIDSYDGNGNDSDYRDHVELTGTYAATPATNVIGAGTELDPWRMNSSNNSISETSSAGNVRVTYSGSVSSITLSLYNGADNKNAKGQHAVFINDLTFSTAGC